MPEKDVPLGHGRSAQVQFGDKPALPEGAGESGVTSVRWDEAPVGSTGGGTVRLRFSLPTFQ